MLRAHQLTAARRPVEPGSARLLAHHFLQIRDVIRAWRSRFVVREYHKVDRVAEAIVFAGLAG